MDRRKFLLNGVPAAAVLSEVINGFAIKAFNNESPLVQAFLQGGTNINDNVLVIIQLSGGNDGLNMVIPVGQYSRYYNARTNIAVAEAKVLKLQGFEETGLHPAMTGLDSLYKDGKLKVIQSVGYPTPNFSHFRATDIWMSASNSTQDVYTGWMGRYLSYKYPGYPVNYPNTTMPDPLAVQIGSATSLAFQGESVNMAMSFTNPNSFYNLITNTYDPAPNTRAGKELTFIRQITAQTQGYATAVKNASAKVTKQVDYPTSNSLADQLKIVARLIKGGLKTKVYMVNIGGFDTHASQVQSSDTSLGTHATILKRLSDAIKAFQDDLKFLEIEDRVMGITFSEFGRRIKSNLSVGTDHGAAAPMFIFGSNTNPGVLGINPDIPVSATVNDNIPMQYDFRSVYATMLTNWFCLDKNIVASLFPPEINIQLQALPLVKEGVCKADPVPEPPDINEPGAAVITNYPNPFTESTTIKYTTAGGHTMIQIIDMLGRVIKVLFENKNATAGTYTVTFNAAGLAHGVYYARFQNGTVQQVLPMLKVR